MPGYDKIASSEINKEMHKFKEGTAHSGPDLKKITSRKQAIAIGLSKARKKGSRIPEKS